MAMFIDALSAALVPEWIDAAIMRGRFELPPQPGRRYTAACDPSGGGPASFTFTIVHTEGQGADRRLIQDVMQGWGRRGAEAPDLNGIVKEIATHPEDVQPQDGHWRQVQWPVGGAGIRQ